MSYGYWCFICAVIGLGFLTIMMVLVIWAVNDLISAQTANLLNVSVLLGGTSALIGVPLILIKGR